MKWIDLLFHFYLHREFGSLTNNYQCHGAIINKNKIEDFKSCDKLQLINEEGKLIWDDITSGACLERPSLLARFFIFSFGVSKTSARSESCWIDKYRFDTSAKRIKRNFPLSFGRIWKPSTITITLPIHVYRRRFLNGSMNQNLPAMRLALNKWNNWRISICRCPVKTVHFSLLKVAVRQIMHWNISNYPTKFRLPTKLTISMIQTWMKSIFAFRIHA